MSKKTFKYFREGDDYSNIIAFLNDNISLMTYPFPEVMESGDELWLADKKVRITIEIFDKQ